MNIKDELGKKILFFDGAMGTMLQKYGIELGEIPEILNLKNPDIVKKIHSEYLEAGADIITTNTFGVNGLKLKDTGFTVDQIIKSAIALAKEAIKNNDSASNKYIALDIGPTGKLLEPLGDLSFENAYNLYKEVVISGEQNGADLIIIETMSDTYEIKAAILAAKENSKLPIFATMTFDENGRTLTGANIITMVALLEGLGVDCLGINCGLGVEQIKTLYNDLKSYTSIPVIIQPNAGMPVYKDGETHYNTTATEFAKYMLEFAKNGVSVIGGCCGTTPEHIRQAVKLCKDINLESVTTKNLTLVCSYSNTVEIGKSPVIIGERINPTGKKKFKEALKLNNIEYILNEAILQKENGAHILDVNVGLPEIDEKAMMCDVVKGIQKIIDLPLQLDSSNSDVLENALRIYNGKALINSVNGKKEVMEKVFPLVKKYGGVVVGLTLDEAGISGSAEGRYLVAEKIINTAALYGIDKKNIIIDPLTLTISAQQDDAYETLKALNMIKSKLNVKTILGVSNISFGIPQREIMNSTFFSIALYNGLDACIINPCSDSMMNVYKSFKALAGYDKNCTEYIAYFSEFKFESPLKNKEAKPKQADTSLNLTNLQSIIIKGLKDLSYDETVKLLQVKSPMDIINNEIIVALNIVGSDYEIGKIFLPQLMMSAETVKKAFDAIKQHLNKSGAKVANKGTIVMATVKGDIHDIGKNIVCALLENYGYEIIDLGKDVDIELIIKIVKQNNIKLVGLSALMTTTVSSMEKTIKALKDNNCECKVMVGGAVLTKEYADMIGADFYAKDALASVSYANKIFGY